MCCHSYFYVRPVRWMDGLVVRPDSTSFCSLSSPPSSSSHSSSVVHSSSSPSPHLPQATSPSSACPTATAPQVHYPSFIVSDHHTTPNRSEPVIVRLPRRVIPKQHVLRYTLLVVTLQMSSHWIRCRYRAAPSLAHSHVHFRNAPALTRPMESVDGPVVTGDLCRRAGWRRGALSVRLLARRRNCQPRSSLEHGAALFGIQRLRCRRGA